jgi:hypothetical protein
VITDLPIIKEQNKNKIAISKNSLSEYDGCGKNQRYMEFSNIGFAPHYQY